MATRRRRFSAALDLTVRDDSMTLSDSERRARQDIIVSNVREVTKLKRHLYRFGQSIIAGAAHEHYALVGLSTHAVGINRRGSHIGRLNHDVWPVNARVEIGR
jgi:hypothetical protein